MIEGQISNSQSAIASDLADLCLESRAHAAKLKCLLQAHHCGPDAEAIIRRIERVTQKIAERVHEAAGAATSDDVPRINDPWIKVSC